MKAERVERIERAECAIAQLLAELEIEMDALVERVDIRSVDVTTLVSSAVTYRQQVKITMLRRPGHEWAQAEPRDNTGTGGRIPAESQ